MNEQRPETTRDDDATILRPADVPPTEARVLSRPTQVIETVQTVLTALTLAPVFRAFMVEAFIIPTGSMAHSLRGTHATRTCPACGWEYDFVPADDCLCPNCHLRTALPAAPVPHKAGDRVLVHKWPYILGGIFGPRRWDVIVFRNPAVPDENYVKRLIGLPGETVEILDGDVFIDGRIARKTAAAQQVLWFVVFDQNHCPRGDVPAAAGPRWVAEAGPEGSAGAWTGLESRVIRYCSHDDREWGIRFQPHDARYFQDVYAYNRGPSRWRPPIVRDLRLVAEVTFHRGSGALRWELTRDDRHFAAQVRRDGTVALYMAPRAAPHDQVLVGQVSLPGFRAERPYVMEVGHVDYRVYVKIDGNELVTTTDAQHSPDVAALRDVQTAAPVDLRVAARAVDVDLRGLRVDRDVYYTCQPGHARRAYPGHLFVLEKDEYFVLGDNSPDSRDSREWSERGPHLPEDYRVGTVRADQIVGPVAFVYLPGLLPQGSSGRFRLPDVGRVRFVR